MFQPFQKCSNCGSWWSCHQCALATWPRGYLFGQIIDAHDLSPQRRVFEAQPEFSAPSHIRLLKILKQFHANWTAGQSAEELWGWGKTESSFTCPLCPLTFPTHFILPLFIWYVLFCASYLVRLPVRKGTKTVTFSLLLSEWHVGGKGFSPCEWGAQFISWFVSALLFRHSLAILAWDALQQESIDRNREDSKLFSIY